MFVPDDNETILSIGGEDGILVWNFHGDVHSNFIHKPSEYEEGHEEFGLFA